MPSEDEVKAAMDAMRIMLPGAGLFTLKTAAQAGLEAAERVRGGVLAQSCVDEGTRPVPLLTREQRAAKNTIGQCRLNEKGKANLKDKGLADIVGETVDTKCWRIVWQDDSLGTIHTVPKDMLEVIR